MLSAPDPAPNPFAGDLFLLLATEGRMAVDAVRADELIACLERTRALAQARLRHLRQWQASAAGRTGDVRGSLTPDAVDAVAAEQLAPGRLAQAATEIPKYIEALRIASRGPDRL